MLRRASVSTFVLALALVGCGGHNSSSPSPAATAEEKAAVKATLNDFLSTTSYQMDGPMQFSDIDFAIYGVDAAVPPSVNDPLLELDDAPPTTYQNDGLGLWENLPNGESDYSREDYYVDQALTQPAGFCTETIVGTDADSTDAVHYEITAGPYAGSHGDANSTQSGEGLADDPTSLWHETYSRTASNGTVYAGSFDYKGLAYTASATTTWTDGTKDTLTAALDAKDKGTVTFVSHAGVTLTAKFMDSGVATGTLTGDAPGLPARFSLNTEKGEDFTVRFHDGSTAQFGGDAATQVRAKALKAAASRHAARLRARARR